MLNRTQANRMWDDAAPWWVRHLRTDPNRSCQVIPTVLQLLGDPKNRQVLDAGCGEGTLARLIAKAGGRVSGVDFSNLLTFAREEEHKDPLGIDYHHFDIADAARHLGRGHFDAAICILVLHGCPHLDDVLDSLRGMLRAGGELIVCDLNPRFVTPYSSWFHGWYSTSSPPNGSFRVKIADDAPAVPYFFRPAADFIRAFQIAGFRLEQALEPEAPAHLAAPLGQGLFVFWRFRGV